MGLRTYFTPDSGGEEDSLEKILISPNAPVLAVPNSQEDPGNWKKVLIAFDGSPNSCRVLKEFARFAQPYDFGITILTCSKDKAQGDAIVNSAAAYLRAHRLTNLNTVVSTGEIHDVIDTNYIDSSDLVVAGIHSKKFLKDFFVGSLARKLIDYGHTPLFLN